MKNERKCSPLDRKTVPISRNRWTGKETLSTWIDEKCFKKCFSLDRKLFPLARINEKKKMKMPATG